MKSLLVGSFVVGLLGVLSYTLWYQHQLNSEDQFSLDKQSGTRR
jgi:hypothetical protein